MRVGCGKRPRGIAGTAVMVALVAAAPSGALGQQAGDSLTLSLEDALRIAGGANPTYLQAENSLGLNGPEARSAWLGQIVPQLSLNLLQTSYGGTLTRQATDFFGNPIQNPRTDWVFNSNTAQGFSFAWTLQGLNFLTARRQLGQSQRGRELAVTSALATLHADVRRQFYDALEQRSLLEVEEALAEARAKDLESARRLFELARATQVDVLNAEVQIDQQRINVQQQRRAHEQALLTLRTTLGDPELPPLRLTADDVPVVDPTGLNEEALVRRALRDNPRVRTARSSVEGARLGLDEAGSYKWPSVSLQYGLSRFVQTRESKALFDIGYDPNEIQSSFSVRVTVPFLNNFFQNRYQEAQASVQLENERSTLGQTRLDIEQSVRSEVINLRNQYESYRLAVRSQDIAARATALAREEYRLGSRTFEQLQDTIAQEANARRQVIQARFAYLDALIALETAVGGPIGEDQAPGDTPGS